MNNKFDGICAVIAPVGLADAEFSEDSAQHRRRTSVLGSTAKRGCDVAVAILALPVVMIVALGLFLANPLWNPGPVLFRQTRMGRHCRPFTAFKFRTMRECRSATRGPHDPVEHERITPLGRFLRRSRIDEIPQFINILKGDMSLIGPRPDFWDHAVHFIDSVPGYQARHAVKPGITGLAQVHLGYAEGLEATFKKVRYDLEYIRTMSLSLELHVLWRTVIVVTTGFGAR